MDNIWIKWEEHYRRLGIDPQRICKDGINDPKEFVNTKCRILFITKDANDYESGDLKEMLCNGPRFQMWHTIARWAVGILNDFPPFEQIDNNKSLLNESLRKIATINLKKTSGGAKADMSVINAYAHQDRELLLEQIDSIKPNLIVSCGVMDSLIWLLDLEVDPEKPYKNPVEDKLRNALVIPWRHPTRANNNKTYNGLKEIIKSADIASTKK